MEKDSKLSRLDLYLVILVLFSLSAILFVMKVVFVITDDLYYCIYSLLFSTIVILIVLYRRQSLSSIGFKKDIIPILIIITLTILIAVYAVASNKINIFYRWIYYLVIVSTLEELIFRGYSHNRINYFLNSNKKTNIILGCIFGLLHGFSGLRTHPLPLTHLLNQLGGGIVGHAIYYYIYAKSNNLLYPIIIHAILDFLPYLE